MGDGTFRTIGPQRSGVEERLVGADRVIAVLTELADHPLGVTLEELASTLKSSKSTVHRALATLRRAGLADLMGRGVYVLGDEFIRLALRNLGGRPETARVQPVLEALAAQFGETAHYAVLSGTDIVYRAKMDPPQGAVRLTSVIGGRNPAHRTAVGKALLSTLVTHESQLVERFGSSSFAARTPHTITSTGALLAELESGTRPRICGRRSGERSRHQLRRDPRLRRRLRSGHRCDQHQRGGLQMPARPTRGRGAVDPRDHRGASRTAARRLGVRDLTRSR